MDKNLRHQNLGAILTFLTRYLTEVWELSSLAHKLSNIKDHLVDIIERCYRFIGESLYVYTIVAYLFV